MMKNCITMKTIKLPWLKLGQLFCFFILVIFTSCQSAPIVYQFQDKAPEAYSNISYDENPSAGTVENIDIEVVEYEAPEDGELEEEEGEGNPVSQTAANTWEYTITPKKLNYTGGAVTYNYVKNNVYSIFSAPFKTVDIELQPGEKLVSMPVCGDIVNFNAGVAHSFVDGVKQEHVHLKAIFPNRETTLTLNTSKRVYRFRVYSYKNTYMPIVNFNYPIETLERITEETKRAESIVNMTGNITEFEFSYDIIPMSIHKPAWTPSLVFTDKKRTYIHFPSARAAAHSPVLLEVVNGERILVNYRVAGDYYIVDSIINHAELVLDINVDNVITIKRRN